MAGSYYKRLSALDASFLRFEERNVHWHEAAVMVFERKPLATSDGGLDFDKVLRNYQWSFEGVPCHRQRLLKIPLFDYPVWVDDPKFNIRYHIRQVALPQPADERVLKRVCGHLLELPLDMEKPPWEVWVVDDPRNDRFALVTKIHHCMADGVSGMSILHALLRPQPFDRESSPAPWVARPAPSSVELVKDELVRRSRAPVELFRPLRRPMEALQAGRDVARGLAEALHFGWHAASRTPFNPEHIGAHRRFDWTEVSLQQVKEVRSKLGGTVNDVVLATAAGAFGRFLGERGIDLEGLDFRALIPVSLRRKNETELGNRVAMIMVELPVAERDPVERLYRVSETMQRLKHSKQAEAVSWLEGLADRFGGRFFVELSRSVTRHRPFNVAITNVPGPTMPLYFLGSRMQAIYPMLPLFPNQALSVAVLSYCGKIFWGFNSDWDALPDVHQLVDSVQAQFTELHATAQRPLQVEASATL